MTKKNMTLYKTSILWQILLGVTRSNIRRHLQHQRLQKLTSDSSNTHLKNGVSHVIKDVTKRVYSGSWTVNTFETQYDSFSLPYMGNHKRQLFLHNFFS